jgi:copper homeostasis protein CutC
MADLADERIEILPGGGIHSGNVERIVRDSGADQVHLYLAEARKDLSTTGNRKIYFGAFLPSSEVEIRAVEEGAVREVREILDCI